MTSPSGALGAHNFMGRMPSMGLGNLESMELPDSAGPLDANAAAAMLHDMPSDRKQSGSGPPVSAAPAASSAPAAGRDSGDGGDEDS